MAQDRCAAEAAFACGSLGIEVVAASFRSAPVTREQDWSLPWLAPPFRLVDDGERLPAAEPGRSWQSPSESASLPVRGIWAESDLRGDANGASAASVVGGSYMALYRARNSFGTAEDTFCFGFDTTDTGAGSLDCGLLPSFVLAVGLDGQERQDASVAVHAASHLGIYAQLGIAPSFTLARLGEVDVTFAMPLTMGFCLKNYYVDVDGRGDLFGYVDLGAVASSPLPFLPSRVGSWHVDLGLHWLLFGDSNEQRQAGESSDLIVSLGLGTTF